jgi:hypothetical protein
MQTSAINAAVSGVARANNGLYNAANSVTGGKPEDLTKAALGFGDAAATYKASALTLKTARATQKSLFDALI